MFFLNEKGAPSKSHHPSDQIIGLNPEGAVGNWIPPVLATLLADPYGVVRYVSEKALRSLVDYPDWNYDFLAETEELAKQPEALRSFWSLVGAIDVKRESRVLLKESGVLQRRKLYGLLRERDNRSITIKE